MTRSPQKPAQRTDFVAKATASWGEPPAWVLRLAEEVNLHGQGTVGKRIGYSAATVSQVLSNTYRGVVPQVEERVRGALMNLTVQCPVDGEMRRDVCLNWQAKEFTATSAHSARMYRACRSGCPFSKHTKETNHGQG